MATGPFLLRSIMINFENEQLLSLADAAKELPNRPNVATLWRWRTKGIRGVRLETLLCGGRRMTSREALARFLEGVTAAADGPQNGSQSSLERDADQRRGREELIEAGIIPRQSDTHADCKK
jgi:hypothetical protein